MNLKNGPFCEHSAYTTQIADNEYDVICNNCSAGITVTGTRDESITAWNTRAPTLAERVATEAVRVMNFCDVYKEDEHDAFEALGFHFTEFVELIREYEAASKEPK